jgi:hypothetical protein
MRSFRRALDEAIAELPEVEARPSRAPIDPYADVREMVAAAPPAWAAALGLDLPCDVSDVRRAFRRLARKTHPDCAGGSHYAFLAAQRVLEEALVSVRDAPARAFEARFASVSGHGSAVYA